ncbi:MAG: choice-of-anchor D domain-containing protein [Bacteroidota bacterium]|nr:choice-of-anchor D domain-containing protein [Bacteroidota bacterium]
MKNIFTKFILLFIFIMYNMKVEGQYKWKQQGIDIDGEADGDFSGNSVSISSDGLTVAIGANYNDGNGNNSGQVRIYKNINGIWLKQGADIDGEAINDFLGFSVSLSSDGLTVAIGAPHNDGNGSNSGHVRVYKLINQSWIQQGQDIDGEAISDFSGNAVSLSSDGLILAIGANGNDGNGSNSGHVRVYKLINQSWIQQGQDIDGEYESDGSGFSVSLSSDGLIIAISAPYNSGAGTKKGHVRVYRFVNGNWIKQGVDIDGEANFDYSGWIVSLSSDGLIVAIGAINNSGNGSNSGHVRVYKFINGNWIKQGSDIDGEAIDDYSGYSLSLSSDGLIVAIGAYNNAGGGIQRGHVRVYKNISGIWTKQGTDIHGEADNDKSGISLSLSSDGLTVAIGAYGNAGGGLARGHVRVYKLTYSVPKINLKGNNLSIANRNVTAKIADSTNFGIVNNGTKRSYKINNFGTDTLKITGSTVTGTHAADFTLSGMPTVVNEGDSAMFTVTFNTSNTGVRNATITINSNDTSKPAYTFAISASAKNLNVENYNMLQDEIKVYPNPVSNLLNIELNSETAQLSIMDFMGKTILNDIVNQNATIDVSELANGIYTIHIKTKTATRSVKLIKQ